MSSFFFKSKRLASLVLGLGLGTAALTAGTNASFFNQSGRTLRLVPTFVPSDKIHQTFHITNYDLCAWETTKSTINFNRMEVGEVLMAPQSMITICLVADDDTLAGLAFDVFEGPTDRVGSLGYSTGMAGGKQYTSLSAQFTPTFKAAYVGTSSADVTLTLPAAESKATAAAAASPKPVLRSVTHHGIQADKTVTFVSPLLRPRRISHADAKDGQTAPAPAKAVVRSATTGILKH